MRKTLFIGIIIIILIGAATLYLIEPNGGNGPVSISTTTIYQTSITTTATTIYQAPINISGSLDNFAIKSYSLINDPNNESSNIFFSPFSIYAAMSMTAEGAKGQTLNEMQNALELSDNSTANHLGFENLMNNLTSKSGAYNLSIADSVWIEKTYPVYQEFSSALSTYYNAAAYEADFQNNATGETTKINNWVANNTNNKILNLIPSGAIDALTRLVIVNALHFKGSWLKPFDKNDTQNATFFVAPGKEVNASLMFLPSASEGYYSNSQFKALEMNYNGSPISMLIILPNQNYSLSQVESGLSTQELLGVMSNLKFQSVNVWLPKFNITTPSKKINDLLIALGMKSAFDPGAANFSGIANFTQTQAGLYISAVYHKAFINLNENGTEAAAATAVIMTTNIAPNPPQSVDFRVDHPFIFFIIDKKSGAILFMGRIADPTKTS